MKRRLIAVLLGLLPFLPPPVFAQEATEAEKAALAEIAKCLVAGLPPDWRDAEMAVELPRQGSENGEVSYLFRRSLSGGEWETFTPCSRQAPARALVELRAQQPAERAAWTSARFTLHRDGTFDLHYDYPPKPPQ
ncbi:MAG: hypothetical protein JO035_08200 [Betaproteobacteria bacterium]|nr:hypothetical protein [Betaproteobacteria bacterium]